MSKYMKAEIARLERQLEEARQVRDSNLRMAEFAVEQHKAQAATAERYRRVAQDANWRLSQWWSWFQHNQSNAVDKFRAWLEAQDQDLDDVRPIRSDDPRIWGADD